MHELLEKRNAGHRRETVPLVPGLSAVAFLYRARLYRSRLTSVLRPRRGATDSHRSNTDIKTSVSHPCFICGFLVGLRPTIAPCKCVLICGSSGLPLLAVARRRVLPNRRESHFGRMPVFF